MVALAHRRAWLIWLLPVAWYGVECAGLLALVFSGESPVDFASYARAADALAAGGSPYADSAEAARGIWRLMHGIFIEGRPVPDGPPMPGPYLYPPSLALFLARTGLPAWLWVVGIYGAILGVCVLWRRYAPGAGPWILLLAVLSWDVAASFSAGNAEVLLIFLSLVACRSFRSGHALLAGALAAVVVLVKPFCLAVFVGFAVLSWWTAAAPKETARRIALGVLAGVAVAGLEVLLWPAGLRAEAIAFAGAAQEHTFLVLPLEAQRPASDWNRAPVQVFLSLGAGVEVARALAGVLWAAVLAGALALIPRRPCGFAPLFALAWLLMYLARPISFAVPFLEFFVVGAAWPVLGRRGRIALLLGAAGLMASHWIALALTAATMHPALFTLQTARVPFEALLVLPGCLALCVLAARRSAATPR